MKEGDFIRKVTKGQLYFKGIDLEGSFINKIFENIIFENCFIEVDFTGSHFKSVTFKECNLKTCIFKYTFLQNVIFVDNALDGSDFKCMQYDTLKFERNGAYGGIFTKKILDELLEEGNIGFHIVEVHAGWFEVLLIENKAYMHITTSNYLGHDGAKDLLRELGELCEENIGMRWICWDEEPGAFLWKLSKKGNEVQITVYTAQKASDQIQNRASLEHEKIFDTDIVVAGRFDMFIREVIDSFDKFISIWGVDEYERQWDDFPKQELDKLRKYIK